MSRRLAIRADASVGIGAGHVMRCLALAEPLRERHAEVVFLCRELEGDLCDLIAARGFPVLRLPRGSASTIDWQADARHCSAAIRGRWQRADWLLVDHYQLDARWERALRPVAGRIMAIDDVPARLHDCDILLDQNQAPDMHTRYAALLPPHCRQLLGPAHALLRDEFRQARQQLAPRPTRTGPAVQRILVFFGGSDPGDETSKALQAIRQLDSCELHVDVVVGSANPHAQQVKALCRAMRNTRYHCQIDDMARLMTLADLAVGAGGSSTWERCCLGLPALVAVLAENQSGLTAAAAACGVVVNLGWAAGLIADDYRRAIEACTAAQLADMRRRGCALVDGEGALRVAAALMGDTDETSTGEL